MGEQEKSNQKAQENNLWTNFLSFWLEGRNEVKEVSASWRLLCESRPTGQGARVVFQFLGSLASSSADCYSRGTLQFLVPLRHSHKTRIT